MNLNKIFEMQKSLDDAIHKSSNVKPHEITSKRICALLVEIGEFANEIAPFKYWKKQKNIDRDKVLEEYIDGIHFLTSLAIFVGLGHEIQPKIKSSDLTEQLNEIYITTSHLSKNLSKKSVLEAFELYLGMASLVNISDEEFEQYYIKKNEVNFERIANGY